MIDASPDQLTLSEILQLSPSAKASFGLEFTPSEIVQQPETWLETLRIVKTMRSLIASFVDTFSPTSVTLIGAGTSDYIGRAVAPLLRRKWKVTAQAVPSTDLLTDMKPMLESERVDPRPLWISFSRSGDSFEGVKVLETAIDRYPQIAHLIVTCSKGGKMANKFAAGKPNVLCVVLDDKTNDRGLAMTSSFTNMVVAGQCLAHINDLTEFEGVVSTISAIAADHLSDIADTGRKIAADRFERICFLGSGPLRAVAEESSLKVLELSGGFHSTMSESFLGLRHGPLSWLNKRSLVVGFVSNDAAKQKIELGLLEEVRTKAAAGSILAIGPDSLDLNSIADTTIELPLSTLADDYLALPYVLFAQCLGLYSSLTLGLKPDAPSSDGKIRRVVSDIKIA
ncbi:MAG TPA: SIS domain-containing protein [Pyrinomonadaceae bacterium]|nr:SIS domain-containing protein [Pyrinomonadaceae bacterium]